MRQRATTPLSNMDPTDVYGGTSSDPGSALTASRSDHFHELYPSGEETTLVPGGGPVLGNEIGASRGQHRHGLPNFWWVVDSGFLGAVSGLTLSSLEPDYRYRLRIRTVLPGGVAGGITSCVFNGIGGASNYSARVEVIAAAAAGAQSAAAASIQIAAAGAATGATAAEIIDIDVGSDLAAASWLTTLFRYWRRDGLGSHFCTGGGNVESDVGGVTSIAVTFGQTITRGSYVLEAYLDE